MAFILNPYDATLNLADRDGKKLIDNRCKGLKVEYTFDGQKGNYTEIVKLVEKYLEDIRVMCVFEVATVWHVVKRSLIQEGMIDIFNHARRRKS